MQGKSIAGLGVVVALLLGAATAQAAPISSGYDVSFVTTPGAAAGDVVAVGGAIFVGSGAFGAQSIVRIDGGGTTVLAAGFTAIGGIAYDAVNDRLIVGDNGTGALTGDTIYGVANPFGSPGTPAGAAGLELLPIGSTPGFADLILDPSDPTGNSLFISDASESFPPLGTLLQANLLTQTLTPLQSGLSFAAGLGTDGATLFFGDSLLSGSGDVASVPVSTPGSAANPIGNYATGVFDLEVESDGSLLITSGGSILRIDPLTGASEEIASGFGFAAGLFAGDDGTFYAVDGFADPSQTDRVWIFTPVPEPGTALLIGTGLGALALRRRQSGSRS
jgi:hypothetical protein